MKEIELKTSMGSCSKAGVKCKRTGHNPAVCASPTKGD